MKILLPIGLIASSLVASCSSHAAPHENVARLKIGTIAPLSGPLAEYGVAVKNGMALARTDSPQIDQRCSFIIEDSKYDPKTAVAALNKLTASDHVNLVYNWGGPTSDALAPIADRSKIPLFVWSADPKVAEQKNFVIRFANSGADYGKALVEYLYNKGYRSVGLIKTDNQYIEAILAGVTPAAAGKISIDTVDSYQPADQDFRATITKIKGRQYDAFGVFLLSGQVSQFANQLRAQNVSMPLFGTDFFESMTEVKQANGGLTGAVFANNEVTPDFRATYVQKFGNDFQINHAASGYDFARFICDTLVPALEKFSPEEIISKAAAIEQIDGKQGKAIFTTSASGDRYYRFPVVMRSITESEIISVQ